MEKKDFLLIAAILSIGFSLLGIRFLFEVDHVLYAEIAFEHGVQTVCLDENRVFCLPDAQNVLFEVRDGQVAFIESDCPDQFCVHAGFQGRSGRIVACLPNRLVLSIIGGSASVDDLDIFVGRVPTSDGDRNPDEEWRKIGRISGVGGSGN
ncbi:MAG: NusG domain II-containing protein, partial [Defluviitaleaceae bacterium]|nr:NusG domain II-containing protein [Defluviitaleaceae bacterium]